MTVPERVDPARTLRTPEKVAFQALKARHTVQTRAEIVNRSLNLSGERMLIVAEKSNEVRTQCLFSEHWPVRIIVGDQPMRLIFRQRRQE